MNDSASGQQSTSRVTTARFVVDGGLNLVADLAGDPQQPAVLLIHGGGQTRHSWRTALTTLADRGYHAVAIDQRGHGDSDWSSTGDYSADTLKRDVVAVATRLHEPAIVGASLGGVAALLAVAENADQQFARALVLVDVAPRVEAVGIEHINAFMREHMITGFGSLDEVSDAIQAYNPHRAAPPSTEGLKRNVRLRADGRWYWHWDPALMTRNLAPDEATRLNGINPGPDRLESAARVLSVPTLLVRGQQSDLLSAENAQRFLHIVPHAEFVDVAGAGHMVAGDRNDVFLSAIVNFVDRSGG